MLWGSLTLTVNHHPLKWMHTDLWQPIISSTEYRKTATTRAAMIQTYSVVSFLFWTPWRRVQTMTAWLKIVSARGPHLLEPPLAVLALVSDPSSVTDAGSVYTFSREAVLVTRFGRWGVSEQHEVKQNIHHQVSVDTPQVAVGGSGYFGSKKQEFRFTFPPWIHFCPPLPPPSLPSPPTPRSVDRAEWKKTGAFSSAFFWRGSRESPWILRLLLLHLSQRSPAYSLSLLHTELKSQLSLLQERKNG